MLMFSWDFEARIWSRFVLKLVIWNIWIYGYGYMVFTKLFASRVGGKKWGFWKHLMYWAFRKIIFQIEFDSKAITLTWCNKYANHVYKNLITISHSFMKAYNIQNILECIVYSVILGNFRDFGKWAVLQFIPPPR